VTAKLSRKFYEKFGDELTNELVEWGNDRRESFRARWTPRIALTYELNFARFEAKLVGELNRLEARMSAFEARIIRWMFVFWVGTLGTLIALRTL